MAASKYTAKRGDKRSISPAEMAGRELRLQVESGARPVVAGQAARVTAVPATVGGAIATPAAQPPPARVAPDAMRRIPAVAGATPVLAALDGDPGRRALMERALEEPALRSVLDLFGGEIVEIEPV